eukprot:gene11356-biopygen9404
MPQKSAPAMPQKSAPAMPQKSAPAMPQKSAPAMPQKSAPVFPEPQLTVQHHIRLTPSVAPNNDTPGGVAPGRTEGRRAGKAGLPSRGAAMSWHKSRSAQLRPENVGAGGAVRAGSRCGDERSPTPGTTCITSRGSLNRDYGVYTCPPPQVSLEGFQNWGGGRSTRRISGV